MTIIDRTQDVPSVLEQLFTAPATNPEILPSVLPLIVGAVVIELYFGKHKRESLGWNSSVANAVIWITTGALLIVGGEIESILERYMAYLLIVLGSLTAYMDFYHKWSEGVAFMLSSSGLVYSLAYVTVVIVKTDITVNSVSLKASAAFVAAVTAGFKVLQAFEAPARDDFLGR